MKRSEARRHVRTINLVAMLRGIKDPLERAQFTGVHVCLPDGTWKPIDLVDRNDERACYAAILRYLQGVHDRRVCRRLESQFTAGGDL